MSAGRIFMCNAKTRDECLDNLLFGLPRGSFKELRASCSEKTKIFLLDYSRHELHGVFRANGIPGVNLNPLAFGGSERNGSPFSAQLRVFREETRKSVLRESAFKTVLTRRGTHWVTQLTQGQVDRLRALFEIQSPLSTQARG